MKRPSLSIICIVHNMRREAVRTLHSLSEKYQIGVDQDDYEVIVVDNGSSEPLLDSTVDSLEANFSYLRLPSASPSPVAAINQARQHARGDWITICIDGARILSPGVLRSTITATNIETEPIVATFGWHLGDKIQNEALEEGYDTAREDELLASIEWRENGYRLFEISTIGASCAGGWFQPFSESNCLTVSASLFDQIGGMCENFQSRGGGLANLDFFERSLAAPDARLVILLGEGTFHQIHGGVASNAPADEHPWPTMQAEYERIRNRSFSITAWDREPIYLGTVHEQALPFLEYSATHARQALCPT